MPKGYRTTFVALVLVLSLLATFALAGCGGAAKTEETAATTGAETKTETKAGPVKVDFESESVGENVKSFATVIGPWSIVDDGGNKVLQVDGTNWTKDTVRPDAEARAKQAFPDDSAAYLEFLKAHSTYEFAVNTEVDNFKEGEISMRFKGISGVKDQAAGIAFDVKPNGDYLTIRANPVEDNVNFFEVVAGTRNKLKEVPNVPTPKGQWNTFKVVIVGTDAKAYLNDKLVFESPLKAPVDGKVGIYAKDDSKVMYDDYTVTPK